MSSGSTPNYSFPYPILTDPVKFTDDMEDLAVSIDSRLINLVTGTGQVPATADQENKYLYSDGTNAFWNSIPSSYLESVIVSSNSLETLDSFKVAEHRSAEYTIQADQPDVSKKTLMKVLVIHDDTQAYITSFGIIEIGSSRIPLDASVSISGEDLLLQVQVSDASTNNVEFEIIRTALSV
jgi:hypothetical protein